jgi:hypothetical protein
MTGGVSGVSVGLVGIGIGMWALHLLLGQSVYGLVCRMGVEGISMK